MKKYSVLLLVSVFFITLIPLSGRIIKKNIPYVSVCTISTKDVENTVICSGRVEYADADDIYSDGVCIVSSYYVAVNDKIKEGEPLFTIKCLSEDIDIDGYYEMLSASGLSINNFDDNNYSEITVYAPQDGTVKAIKYPTNEVIPSNSVIMSIISNNNLQIKLPISESKISGIKIGQKVSITGNGFSDKTFYGTVKKIADEATQTTTSLGKETTVDVIVQINDITDIIKPGYTTKCTITVSVDKNKIVVPYDDVLADDDGNEFVYVFSENKAYKKYVETGEEYESGVEILSGITTDSLLIDSPSDYRDGGMVVPVWNGAIYQ